MILKFQLTRKDSDEFQKFLERRLRAIGKVRSNFFLFDVLVGLPVGVAVVTFINIYLKSRNLRGLLIVLAVALILLAIALIARTRYGRKNFLNLMFLPENLIFQPQVLNASDVGLSVEIAGAENRFLWSNFQELCEDQDRIYLFIDNSQAVIIPKHSLESAEQLHWLTEKIISRNESKALEKHA